MERKRLMGQREVGKVIDEFEKKFGKEIQDFNDEEYEQFFFRCDVIEGREFDDLDD